MVDMQSIKNDPHSALVEAVFTDDIETARLALKEGASPNLKARRWEKLIFDAAYQGFEDMFSLLIDAGADLSAKDSDGNTVAHYVAIVHQGDDVKRSRMMYRACSTGLVDMDAHNEEEMSACDWAAANGMNCSIMALHQCGAKISNPNFHGQQAIHFAVDRAAPLGFTKLLYLGADMSATYRGGESAKDMLKDETLKQLYAIFESMPSLELEVDGLKREDLIDTGEFGTAPLENPKVMRQIATIFEKMDAAGSRLTREDWLGLTPDGARCWLEVAVMCGVEDKVFKKLAEQGEHLLPEDLQKANGKPTQLANTMAQSFSFGNMFTVETVNGQSREDVQALYDAVPEKATEQVRNLHQLKNHISRSEHTREAMR